MEIYLVGGAVRDELLKRPIKERDWVVVGATPEEMLKKGYQLVGKDFPVFLHPKTKEEYALARTERKSGKGYKGFVCYAAPDVTLVDDLKRRDITINAMAKADDGALIDPYHGQEDIKHKWLRHVSPAFAEDPLRVLRVARFAADLTDFKVYPQTLDLMKSLSESGELLDLTPDRIWKELEKALKTAAPVRFFEVLQDCQAAVILFPEIKNLEILNKAAGFSASPLIRLASLMTQVNESQIISLSKRVSIPAAYQELAILVSRYHFFYKNLFNLSASDVLMFLKKADAFRRPERFRDFLDVCQVIEKIAFDTDSRRKCLEQILAETSQIRLQPDETLGIAGKEIGEAIDKRREESIKKALTGSSNK